MVNYLKWILYIGVFATHIFTIYTVEASSITPSDTTQQLAPAVVKGYVTERFLAGQKFRKIDENTLAQFQFSSLSDLLSATTPLAIKNYGPGQLATISFRGTSASHTAVLWNGVNINQPTLGQTDFSSIAMGSFDEMGIQFGSSSSVTGTDAVGGSIHLNSKFQAQEGITIQVGHSQGSFQNRTSQLRLSYGKAINERWRLASKTHMMLGEAKNQFKQSFRQGYPMSVAQTDRKTFVQDLYLRSTKGQEISAHVWLSDNKAVLQPNQLEAREMTHTKAYRTMLKYSFQNWEMRGSWIRDILNYGKGDYSTMSLATTDKTGFQITKEWDGHWGNHLAYTLRSGSELTHIATRVSGYNRNFITEIRADVFTSARVRAYDKWLLSANIRQAFVTGFNPPVTPSVGLDYIWLNKNKWQAVGKASVSRSYRVPTLNERYWEDIGDPSLQPEHGWSKELGLEVTYIPTNTSKLALKTTTFHKRIHHWTFWNPLKGNQVENLQEVVAKGVETEIAYLNKNKRHSYGSTLLYSFTHSSQQKIYDAYAADIIGKQLPLTPKHTGNFTTYWGFREYRLTAQVALHGKSYQTSEETQPLPQATLLNIFVEGTLHSKSMSLRIQPQVINVFNAFYLDVRRNAMPGRSYVLQLVASFHTK